MDSGSLGQFPVSKILEGSLGSFESDSNLAGMLGGLPDEDNIAQGELGTLPDEASFSGKKQMRRSGLKQRYPKGYATKGFAQKLNYYSDLKASPHETPQQYLQTAGRGKGTKGGGHYVAALSLHHIGGHYVPQTKGRKQSLLMLKHMSLKQKQMQRVRVMRLAQMLKVQGQEVACGVVACNPDQGCNSQAFASCLAEVKQSPFKEKELLDMHRAEVLKLVKENKQLLAVKQLSAQRCVVETCSEQGCDNSKFVGCIKNHVLTAEKATVQLRMLRNKHALVLRKMLAARHAAFLKLSREKRAAYIHAVKAKQYKKMQYNKMPSAKAAQVKKQVPKKSDAKKTHARKADAKKTLPKQADAKKAEPKKADAIKTEPKQAEAKRIEPKKADAKKTKPKEADANKTMPKKADAKKSPPNKADANKSQPKQADATIQAPHKSAATKQAPSKADAKTQAPQSAAPVSKIEEHGSNELLKLMTGH